MLIDVCSLTVLISLEWTYLAIYTAHRSSVAYLIFIFIAIPGLLKPDSF